MGVFRLGVVHTAEEQRTTDRKSHQSRDRSLALRQHVVGDGVRQRTSCFDAAEERQHDQEIREVADGQDTARNHVDAFRRLRTEVAQTKANRDEDPEELLGKRTVLGRPRLGAVEPGQECQHDDRTGTWR